ncbi:MAG: hypothetical protein JNM71_12650 [Flavobacterium lindanitolerans]|nr:hypothetical protein [Flavobacterium lindanitolerans]MBL7868856.1 hypothetical protein [Flavobacterium lindanitolerans]
MIHTQDYIKTERLKAQKALEVAKAIEAQKRASGAKFYRVNDRTFVLSK